MMRRLLATAFLLLTAASLPGKGEPQLTEQTRRSGGAIDPDQARLRFDAADLRVEVKPETVSLEATATLRFTARAPLDRLVIDLDRNLGPRTVAIDGVPLPASAFANPEGRLNITLPHRIAAGGTVTATIGYGGTPHIAVRAPWDDGMVWSKTPDGRPWIASTTEGSGCDLLWPCLDFPTGEPEVVTLHITVPKGLKAPSNGVLLGVDTLADGRTTWHWRVKHPNTYAIALNVAPYEVISGSYKSRYGNSIPLYYWYLPGEEAKAKALFAEFAPTLDFYEANVGPYPWGDEKVGVVETPHLGMEHQTINAYGNGYRKAPEGFDWLFQHEFGHEWFGNQLTAADWDDYWLHEGYAEYMQPLYGRWREGEARYATMLDAQRNQILDLRPIVSGQPRTQDDVYQLERGGPGADIYYKGAWMLHTLRNLIGDRAFRDVTRLTVYGRLEPRPGNFRPRYGTTAEYERDVRRVTGKDFGWFFDVYLRQAALPELIETRQGDRLNLRWQVPGGHPFPMPVEVQVDGRIVRVAMAGGTGSLVVPRHAHFVSDPFSRILKRSRAVEDFQAWKDSEARKAQAK
ncbi:M1 family metallopeptidase [Sphingomonas sp. AR_OL41]|uniref:M1 family metallopeptidase n=1 Tax=Sphingomonas sp. AR_OL41 TaxID=3042729 RepID=UPI0024804132|nr:M1 family metallopeptidase [Sphingomonas sp. AR_OL41]MDH7972293.1 M1 family metallopeptidase [Sphingomonas sp. AR_OL41]